MVEKPNLPKGTILCLDKGFVRLVDSMGGDDAIVQAARVSYGKGTSKVSQDRGLIRYLMRHRHTTPFEMVEFKFHAKMPIFVARQWVRHRTANINEYSLRYSEARDEFYTPDPEHIQFQSALNKQGRAGKVPKKLTDKVIKYFMEISERSFEMYQELNEAGLARELIRAILPVNLYTEWYWKNDLHNLLHFIGLRSDPHAQYEIRVYSDAMATFVKQVAPFAWEAYQDYVVDGMRFSRIEQGLLESRLPDRVIDDVLEDLAYQITSTLHKNKPRKDGELYSLYKKQDGSDTEFDFQLKWDSGEIETGNVREMREFKQKLKHLKK
ncbi:MAG TPA: FAD-dependent thymidylate synthase [Candidatus Marinimicrobia bacterium]|jgi:thymidylate synthase (FAD)|nr:FAD-dependent thymidylate synthase [Candidatus Neomarinimicrobiota bacterium]HIB02591.1 FAD-dependent thymidylate synthase [Candidatus Neomarinimicrobiota bacterium]HIB95068.1 FAD-dependent thymidylate synthase [Candidatus Neomarinimicrobiota bacterium]HIO75377.1 FAD-dependent thymidylate synthase [Candidatus Neomarinimicrobiota bacterium]HIO89919.1 FAD-dependent thymidylate synthase [Candidatus Neomarinimicrobiota bacterium]